MQNFLRYVPVTVEVFLRYKYKQSTRDLKSSKKSDKMMLCFDVMDDVLLA